MKFITTLADKMLDHVVPQKSADACVPPDCFTRRCCYTCTGALKCS